MVRLLGCIIWIQGSSLDHGADFNARDNKGLTPLITAAQKGHLPLVDLLVLLIRKGSMFEAAKLTSAMELLMFLSGYALDVVLPATAARIVS